MSAFLNTLSNNLIISYDLNGPVPTHAQVDRHIGSVAHEYGRILETVWYVRTGMSLKAMYDHMNAILSSNDRLIVIDARDAWFRNLLITAPSIQESWAKAA